MNKVKFCNQIASGGSVTQNPKNSSWSGGGGDGGGSYIVVNNNCGLFGVCDCKLTIGSVDLGTCDPLTNEFSVSGNITFFNEYQSGKLIIKLNSSDSLVIDAPFQSPQDFIFQSVPSNGSQNRIVAYFTESSACSDTVSITAPQPCCPDFEEISSITPVTDQVCSSNLFNLLVKHEEKMGTFKIIYNTGTLLTVDELYNGGGTLLKEGIAPNNPSDLSTEVADLQLPSNNTDAIVKYYLYVIFDENNVFYGTEVCHHYVADSINVAPETKEVVLIEGEICDRVDGPTSSAIDLNTLIQSGPTDGVWSDTDGSGGLVGSVFTGTEDMTGQTFTFTYTLLGYGPEGAACENKSFDVEVNVKNCAMDLALQKTSAQEYVKSGEDVVFNIKVINQGYVDAGDIQITDYIPSGFEFIAGNNLGWNDVGDNKVQRIIESSNLSPNKDTSIQIILRAKPGALPGEFINEAEISEIKDTNGKVLPDFDSWPDDNPDNDNDVVPESSNDDEIGGAAKQNPGDDEDDNDIAYVRVFDLALKKEIRDDEPFRYGEITTFSITVYNQGDMPVKDVDVTDYIPSGFSFVSDKNPLWDGTDIQKPVYTIGNTILPGDSVKFDISLLCNYMGEPQTEYWSSVAEISKMRDINGNDVSSFDYDSTPDNDPDNDAGGKPDSPSDGSINGNGTGVPGSEDPTTDEDDSDPFRVKVYDLALRKKLVAPDSYRYNDLLTFEITVFNQGTDPVTDVIVYDSVPQGLQYNSVDNLGWMGSVPIVSTTIPGVIEVGDSAKVQIKLVMLPYAGDLQQWDNYAEIVSWKDITGENVITWDADSYPNSNSPHEVAVRPNGPDDNNIDGHYMPDGTDEDDHDPAGVGVYDLALKNTMSEESVTSLEYGQVVDFEITVYNQGTSTANNIKVVDYIPAGYSFDSHLNPDWTYSEDDSIATTTITEPLLAQDSITVILKLQLKYTPKEGGYSNVAEISHSEDAGGNVRADFDSVADEDPDNDAGGKINTLSDNSIDGDGTGTPGDEDPNTDEDDSDPWGLNAASIGDYVWFDNNNNGLQDDGLPTEVGVEGVTVVLYTEGGQRLLTQKTDSLGHYLFENLIPGKYYLKFEDLPSGSIFANKNQGNDSGLDSDPDANGLTEETELFPGENDLSWGAGVVLLSSMGGHVWHDLDVDGVQEEGEEGIDSVMVILKGADGTPLDTLYTEDGGKYEFRDLNPDWYFVCFDYSETKYSKISPKDTGDDDEKDSDAGENGCTELTQITSAENDFSWDMGLYILSSLGDRVWLDKNGNGCQDSEEEGIEGVEVNLYYDRDLNGVPDAGAVILATQYTDSLGNYKFEGLEVDKYLVHFINPNVEYFASPKNNNDSSNGGCGDEADSDGSSLAGYSDGVTLGEDQYNQTIDQGYYEKSSVGGRVWFDDDLDGIRDDAEIVVSKVKVTLYKDTDGDGVPEKEIETIVTEDTGNYLFADLAPGTYNVCFDLSGSSYSAFTTAHSEGSLSNNDSDADEDSGCTEVFVLNSGDEDLTQDAGVIETCSLGDYVWFDDNADGIQDDTEIGISGVVVTLYDDSGEKIKKDTTDLQGKYLFSGLKPGKYKVHFENPDASDYVVSPKNTLQNNSSSNANLDGFSEEIPLISGQNDLTVDAGFYKGACLEGVYWLEELGNALQDLQDNSDKQVEGVKIRLYNDKDENDSSDDVLFDSTNVIEGLFSFRNIPAGNYYYTAELPAGTKLVKTKSDLGSDNIDSDFYTTEGGIHRSHRFNVQPGGDSRPCNENIDIGVTKFETLPVEVLEFNAGWNTPQGVVALVWSTMNGNNVSYFELYRRAENEEDFVKLVAVEAERGSSVQSYGMIDSNVEFGLRYYYRLVPVDFDGQVKAKYEASVLVPGYDFKVNAYPNPVTDKLYIVVSGGIIGDFTVELLDNLGRKVINKIKVKSSGNTTYEKVRLDMRDLPQGTYYIRVIKGTKLELHKIVHTI